MAFTLEDGSSVVGANAYVTEDELDTYADDRATTLASGDAQAAIVRATAACDAIYRARYPGYRTKGRQQGLEWPRTAVYDNEWNPIAQNEIPIEIKNAVCEMAIRELAEPGSMLPDLDRGGRVQSLKAGSVEIVYGANAAEQTIVQITDGILEKLLGAPGLSLSGYANRG